MSIAQRFSKLLARSLDPQQFTEITLAAEKNVRSLPDCIMDVAKAVMAPTVFETIRREAEQREVQARNESAAAVTKKDTAAPIAQPGIPHVQVRMEERYGLTVSRDDLEDIVRLIEQNGPAVKRVSQHMEIRVTYEVVWRGKRIVVIYQPRTKHIVTALPLKETKRAVFLDSKKPRGNARSMPIQMDEWEACS